MKIIIKTIIALSLNKSILISLSTVMLSYLLIQAHLLDLTIDYECMKIKHNRNMPIFIQRRIIKKESNSRRGSFAKP